MESVTEKKLYKGVFNWYKQNLTFYTKALTAKQARVFLVKQLHTLLQDSKVFVPLERIFKTYPELKSNSHVITEEV